MDKKSVFRPSAYAASSALKKDVGNSERSLKGTLGPEQKKEKKGIISSVAEACTYDSRGVLAFVEPLPSNLQRRKLQSFFLPFVSS